ncbi:MAG: RNA polymerase sigma factor [Saprospiraceae bacterium]
MKKHSDHKYIEALQKGDGKLIQEIYEAHATAIERWVLNNNGSSSDAKDIFQEGLVAIYQQANRPGFILTCPLGALLFRICKNKWIDQLRKKNKEEQVRLVEQERYSDETAVVSTVEQVEEENARQKKLDHSFKQLSEVCQKLLKGIAEGVPVATLVVQMGMSNANSLYRRKSACVDRWRKLLK